jgi:hypothetical protein
VSDGKSHTVLSWIPKTISLVPGLPSYSKLCLNGRKLPVFLKLTGASKFEVFASFTVKDPSLKKHDWHLINPKLIKVNTNQGSSYLYFAMTAEFHTELEVVVHSKKSLVAPEKRLEKPAITMQQLDREIEEQTQRLKDASRRQALVEVKRAIDSEHLSDNVIA